MLGQCATQRRLGTAHVATAAMVICLLEQGLQRQRGRRLTFEGPLGRLSGWRRCRDGLGGTRGRGTIRGAWYPYLWPFNLSGHPAVSLPCGWSSDGLPIGLQIVGPWYADRRVLALAAQLERERPCGRPMPF